MTLHILLVIAAVVVLRRVIQVRAPLSCDGKCPPPLLPCKRMIGSWTLEMDDFIHYVR